LIRFYIFNRLYGFFAEIIVIQLSAVHVGTPTCGVLGKMQGILNFFTGINTLDL